MKIIPIKSRSGNRYPSRPTNPKFTLEIKSPTKPPNPKLLIITKIHIVNSTRMINSSFMETPSFFVFDKLPLLDDDFFLFFCGVFFVVFPAITSSKYF